ncbi:MAG: hypothetical protein JKY86_01535, partial [Gammaproteobacteria bacterium]|nr:hypothetical protein [Gammaproteobacteria bacterium]
MNNPLPESPQQEVFVRYIEAFSNKEFAAVASNFSIPALLISSGKPLYIDSTEKLIGLMTTLRKSLPAEYTHTAMQEFELFQFN